MRVLITGAAGFIGFHTSRKLLARGDEVVGFDNLNDYYDVRLKEARLAKLAENTAFQFVRGDLSDRSHLTRLFRTGRFDGVVNLAAQAGVRYSLTNPYVYIESNVSGFLNILECARQESIGHLVYASSSAVYGANTAMPFSVGHNVDHPLSLYAATKRANELMAHSYSHLYGIPTTGLRFFTVYGPWGRPDMAMFLFTKAILADEPIQVFNHGAMRRDFTYVDDIVDGVLRVLDQPARPNADWCGHRPDAATSRAPYRLYNIGNNQPVDLLHLISLLEDALGRKARREFRDLQPGDVPETYADIDALAADFGFVPRTSIEEGVSRFVRWYLDFYGVGSTTKKADRMRPTVADHVVERVTMPKTVRRSDVGVLTEKI
jgi:UDP-glucuronate 4-epimerase